MNGPFDAIRRSFRLSRTRRDLDAELDAELEFHFDVAVRRLVEEGWSESDARAEVNRRFGDRTVHTENIRRIDRARQRQARSRDSIGTLLRDVRMTVRSLLRARSFTAAVVLTLAVGIGANVAVFGVVNRLFLAAPTGVDRPDEVRTVFIQRAFGDRSFTTLSLTYPDVVQFADVAEISDATSVGFQRALVIGEGPESTRADVQGVSSNYFSLLGVGPALGRLFTESESGENGAPSTILSYDYWRSAYGADPGVVGRSIRVGRQTLTVVGVAEEDFGGLNLAPADLWIPLSAAAVESGLRDGGWAAASGFYWLQVIVRVADEVPVETAEAAMTVAHRRGRAEDRFYDPEASVILGSILPGRSPDRSDEMSVSLWLGGVALLIFLTACANVANLVLARATRRKHDFAVRLALGISRTRAMRGVLLEAATLSTIGALGALLIAWWCSGLMTSIFLPPGSENALDLGATSILLVLAIAAATAFAGLLPALQISRPQIGSNLISVRGSGGAGGGRAQTGFLVIQAGVSAILLVGAGLFLHSVSQARSFGLGFRPDPMVEVSLDAMNPDLQAAENERLYENTLSAVSRVPGVRSAAFASSVPLGAIWQVEMRPLDADSLVSPGPYLNAVTTDYFRTAGIEIVAGREFTEADNSISAPRVTIVSRRLAEEAWPGRNAVGQCILIGSEDEGPPPCTEVVGVAEDLGHSFSRDDLYIYYYVPRAQRPINLIGGLIAAVDENADRDAVMTAMNREIRAALPQVRFVSTRPFSERLDARMRSWTLGATALTIFGALALIVAGIGIYSTLSFQVAQRRRELGLRAALGATRERLIRSTLLRGVTAVGAGLAIALAVSAALSRSIEPLLFETSALDLRVYLVVPMMMLAAAVLASLVPSIQATRADPMEALRSD